MDPEILRALKDGAKPGDIATELVRRGLPVPPELEQMAQAQSPDQRTPQAAQQPQQGGSFQDDGSFGGAVVQGATLNLMGQGVERFRKEQEIYAKQHPILNFTGNVVGAVGAAAGLAAASPVALPAGAIARFLYGAGQGGTAAAAEGGPEQSMKERAIRGGVGATLGGVASVVAPPAAGMIGHGIGKLIKPFADKAGVIAENAAALVPSDAAAQMAAREAVAPGVAVPAMFRGMAKTLRSIGNNPRVAVQAEEQAVKRVEMVGVKLREVGDQMEAVVRKANGDDIYATVNPEVRKVMIKNAQMPDMNDRAAIATVKELREKVLKAMKAAKGSPKSKLYKEVKVLTEWLHQEVPDIIPLDKSYKLLSRMDEESKLILKNIRFGMEGNSANKAAGLGSGSPAGSISKAGTLIHAALSPDPKKYGAETAKQLLTPGQVPQRLLDARAALTRPIAPPWKSNLLWSGALGRTGAAGASKQAGLLDEF